MDIQAELISIGNELLSGQTLNTHGRDLGAALATIGINLSRDTTIPDDINTIGGAVDEAFDRVDLVFVSGGLGPTSDDITRDALAKLFGQKIVISQSALEAMTKRYAARGRDMTLAATRQALVLENAAVLPNSAGAAPGQRIEARRGGTLFVLPGPPNEFNAILMEEIIPWLQLRHANIKPNFVRVVKTKGIYESDIVGLLEKEAFAPAGIDLGFYPGNGRVRIRLSAPANRADEVRAAEQTLRALLADHLDES